MANIASLVKRFEGLKSARTVWESHWQELAEYCLPHKATITVAKHPGTRLPTNIYDSTAIQSVQILAAGLHSYMTNPSAKWFALTLQDKELAKSGEVKEWLKNAEDKIFSTLNSSNFNQQIHELYIDFSVFGTPCLYEEEDPEEIVRFYTRPISEVFIAENNKSRVDTVFRNFTYTARQAFQEWGNKAGQKVLDAIEAKKYEEPISFLHIVLPRAERDMSKKDSKNKPFASLYIELSHKKLLSEKGYDEFPFYTPRFLKTSGDVYAYSPASVSLADIKMLNAMSKTIIKATQKQVDPPIILPSDGYILPFKTGAGAINYKQVGMTDEKIDVLNTKGNIPIGMEMENQRRESIKRAFFVDLFLLLAQQPKMTATEVVERVQEKMLILGPVLGRLMSELLDPIIIRTFNILLRNRQLEAPPEVLMGEEYKVEYISPLAKAQRASEAQSMSNLLLAVGEMSNMEPSVRDVVDYDKAAREFADIYNTNPTILRSDDDVQEIREARAEQQKIAQELEMANQGAAALKTATEAEKNLAEKNIAGAAK